MKFSEEQIKKVNALREELLEVINAFDTGFRYGMELFSSEENTKKSCPPNWISDLSKEIKLLMIEELRIGDTYLDELDEINFYIFLGGYFEKINAIVAEANSEYFFRKIGKYESDIIETLKN